jgi:dolichol kinase
MLFEPRVAACAFSVMLIGDAAAALVGRKFGRTKFSNGKSLEGILAFVAFSIMALAVCGCIFSYPARLYLTGFVGIILAAAAEFHEKKLHIDDNFSIPVIVGIAMSL